MNRKLKTTILLALAMVLTFSMAGLALAQSGITVAAAPPEGGTADCDYNDGGVTLSAVANPGWRFVYWSISEDPVLYSDGLKSTVAPFDIYDPNPSFEYTEDLYGIKCTAHFERINESYSVSYHPNGGTGTVPMDMNLYYNGSHVTLMPGTGLTKPGEYFIGWSLTGDAPVTASPFTMSNHDVTFFAVWSPIRVPKTGDGSNMLGILLILSGAALAAAAVLRKKAEN